MLHCCICVYVYYVGLRSRTTCKSFLTLIVLNFSPATCMLHALHVAIRLQKGIQEFNWFFNWLGLALLQAHSWLPGVGKCKNSSMGSLGQSIAKSVDYKVNQTLFFTLIYAKSHSKFKPSREPQSVLLGNKPTVTLGQVCCGSWKIMLFQRQLCWLRISIVPLHSLFQTLPHNQTKVQLHLETS